MKIVTVIGARPQFIKAAVVSRAFRENYPEAKEVIVHTGQHFDANMSTLFFDELDIPHPDYNLNIGGGTHGQNTGRMIEKVEEVLTRESPDYLLVYGDTDSTLAGAMAAVKLHIPVVHVEAGLRSFNRQMPEEINRVLTDHMASLLFAPTATSIQNLALEGISGDKVINVGDVMYDASLYYGSVSGARLNIFTDLNIASKQYILATLHRQENTDNQERLVNIFAGLEKSSYPIILPLHPRTKKMLSFFDLSLPSNIHVIEPVGYLEMIALEKYASLIVTDSGGVQKEAFFHKVPCLTLRDETEWVELIEVKANQLVNADSTLIADFLNAELPSFPQDVPNLYGSGNSGNLIAEYLINR